MNDLATPDTQLDDKTLFSLVTDGDASKLSDANKLAYYKARCDAAGLDYRAQPFAFIKLNRKLVLYALKACTDQLAGKHGVRCEIVDQHTESDIRVVTVRATTQDGRATDEIGAVGMIYPDRMKDPEGRWVTHPKAGQPLDGEDRCNAFMKAVTKAKRRAVLSVCGLGMTDESEMETIPGAQAQLAPAPSVTMPTRLSERKHDGHNDSAHVDRSSNSDHPLPAPTMEVVEPDQEPDLEQQLFDSLECINREQNVKLWATLGSSSHSELDFRDWLESTCGLDSTKKIPKSRLNAILLRLEQPAPLHEDYEDLKPKARFVRTRSRVRRP